MGIEEKVISVLLEDKVGAVNFCYCECRMVPGGSRVGAVGNVSAGYAQLLRVVGCLVNEVHSLKDYKVAACVDQDRNVVNGKQLGEVNRDVNFSRDAIFNEVRKVNERDKHKCSIILRGFECNSVNDVCDKFKEVCHRLNVGAVQLGDVVKIGDKKLFRAKVLNDETRAELLMVTGRLRTTSGLENLYIQKEIRRKSSFRQRQELSEGRRKVRVSAADFVYFMYHNH